MAKGRGSRLFLYAVALLSGAGLAYLTTPAEGSTAHPTSGSARRPPHTERRDGARVQASAQAATLQPTATGEPEPRLEPDPLGKRFAGGKVITGATKHRMILFSFDDGPDRRTTPLLLDRLDAEGVKALFFLTASRIAGENVAQRQQQNIARMIAERGHTIGSHTVDHAQLPLLDDAGVLEQLRGADTIFERVFGSRSYLFRPPGGARSTRVDRLIAGEGYTTVVWNLGSGDFQVRSAEEVVDTWRKVFERRERENGERGGIILLHDTYAWSVDAFQMILADLRARNCALLEKGEELFDIVDDPRWFFEPASKNASAEARPAEMPREVFEARQAKLRKQARRYCRAL